MNLREELAQMKENYPADLAEAEEWCRDLCQNGDRYRRDQLDHRWNGPDGRRHRQTLQSMRPLLLQATVTHVKACVAKTP